MINRRAVILIVEDSPLIMMGAVDLISTAGYAVLQATGADEAIRLLEGRNDIDLVFTDIEMPGTMDGLKLAHYIRNRWPPVRLIVASGRAIIEESQLPADTKFFPKPYSDETIIGEMRRMVPLSVATNLS